MASSGVISKTGSTILLRCDDAVRLKTMREKRMIRFIFQSLKYKIDSQYQTYGSGQMVPLKMLPLEKYVRYDKENNQRDNFLYYLELHQAIWPSVTDKTNTVGRDHKAIFEEGNGPGKHYYTYQRPVIADPGLGKLQVTIPCQRHENIAGHQ